MSERYWLVGDEEGGVGLGCNAEECYDGGRPIAYYADQLAGSEYRDDPAVRQVKSLDELLAVRDEHERTVHGEPVRMTEEVGRADG